MNYLKIVAVSIVMSCCAFSSMAQNGYRISLELQGNPADSLYLAYYYGDKQYIKDTVYNSGNGQFVFEDDEPLPGGMYLLVMPPDNQYIQILVDDVNQRFSLATDTGDPIGSMEVTGSDDNKLFFQYLQFLNERRIEAEDLKRESETDSEKFRDINQRVEAKQQEIITKHPHYFTTAVIKANLPLNPPDFGGTDEEKQVKLWRFTQKHFFDNINLADSRMLRTPFLYERVDHYISKLQVQQPDTLSNAIDFVLEKMKPAEETFKFYLIHFLNTYANSKVVGQDAIYVHLAEKYYAGGEATWADEEQKQEIINNADRLKPILVGKVAPDILVELREGSKIRLHDVQSPYTVLYFWRYDCSHCQKSTPLLKTFYDEYAGKGVKIFAVCVKKDEEDIKECWKYIDEKEIGEWIHTVDPGYSSFFPVKYDIQSTPQIFVLGPDKTILSKRIGAEQLSEVMDNLLNGTASKGE